jgi:putative FmdB family regulatory protein
MALFSLFYPLVYAYTDKESLVPVYEYACIQCDEDYEKERSIHDPVPEYFCDKCGYALQRVYNSFGLQFKGGGFYSTDGRR